jgi:tetratricopeptide (TPR) repeat protein
VNRCARTLAALAALIVGLAPLEARAGLLRGNHPKVQQGTDAWQAGDFAAALEAYEAAQEELPPSPELLYNLGGTYLKLGRPDDAKRAYEAALRGADDSLKARDYYNLGNALVELEQRDLAIDAYRQALKVDPKFELARRNLEVLLRRRNPPQQPNPEPGDGGTPPDGGSDGGTDAGNDGGQSESGDGGEDGGSDAGDSPDAGVGDGGPDAGVADGGAADGGEGDGGEEGDGGSDAGQDGGASDQQQEEGADGGAPDAGEPDAGASSAEPEDTPTESQEIDRQEAERLLDALRRNEKQFLMHQQKQKGRQRAHPEKDW